VITAPPRAADSLIAAAQGINTPFVVAFAVIALVLAVLITASVVAAAVLASYRRIGVLKSVGFTPAQVTATYAVTLAAVTFGLTAVVLATGLGTSLAKLSQGGDLWQHAVVVWAGNKGPAAQRFTPSQQQAMASALAHQPGTASYAAMTTPITPNGGSTSHSLTASVPGAGQQVSITAFRSDASRLAWDITSGHWYTGPGQVVINAAEPGTVGLTAGHAIRITVGGVTVTATITGTVDDPGVVGALLTSWQTLRGATGLTVSLYIVALLPGVKPPGYVAALGKRLGHGYTAEVVTPGQSGSIGLYGDIDTSLIRLLTILVAALAGLGVLNATLMLTREHVHDLGGYKAVGMTPRQAIAMVTCQAIVPGIAAAVIALPAGIALHNTVIHALGSDQPGPQAFSTIPDSVLHVYTAGGLTLLALAGLALAIAGALGPAAWAATARTTTALRTE
jgi:putative ABC transport system permease protein